MTTSTDHLVATLIDTAALVALDASTPAERLRAARLRGFVDGMFAPQETRATAPRGYDRRSDEFTLYAAGAGAAVSRFI